MDHERISRIDHAFAKVISRVRDLNHTSITDVAMLDTSVASWLAWERLFEKGIDN